ncbi:hypothetical protein DV735_g1154, partial [Chaetothyriales sp. CBS 134920]
MPHDELDSYIHSNVRSSESSSPELLATPISSVFSCGRSVSGVSSLSTKSSSSNISIGSRSVSGSKRRGYVRTQGASFAPSAQNRESVMSLGSIAHLQYYFARTGLLNGKGGQMAKKTETGEYDIPKLSLHDGFDASDAAIEEEGQLMWEAVQEDGETVMLPPTVSTYSDRQHCTTPPPDHKTLKKDLVDALENTLQVLESCEKANSQEDSPTQGFHELQGLQILDAATLAIRAARLYYTFHPYPKRLNSIRSDQQLRRELHSIMEMLKKCAGRNFAGGLREDERLEVLIWVSEVGMMIDQETKLEEAERRARRDWAWMDDSRWGQNEEARHLDFLRWLLKKTDARVELLGITTISALSRELSDGRLLDQMHNVAVKESKRQFELIEKTHQDIAKPYRRADNIRYWIKAAERRWDAFLRLDVMGVANLRNDEAVWKGFEDAIRLWASAVRAELTKDWAGEVDKKLHARAKSLAQASPRSSPTKSKSASAATKLSQTLENDILS